MKAQTIIAISRLLEEKERELVFEADDAEREYRKEETMITNENPEKSYREISEITYQFSSYLVWKEYEKELAKIRAAKDDFEEHDFH